MSRMIPSLALLAAFAGTPAASQGYELDLRCTSTDQALSQRLRSLLANEPEPAMEHINLVMARIASARFDCKRGRAERGLETYGAAERELGALEDSVAKAVPPTETAGGLMSVQ
jgi:hypothetical protein